MVRTGIKIILIAFIFFCSCKEGEKAKREEEIILKVHSNIDRFDSVFVYDGEVKFKYPKGENISDFLFSDICYTGGYYFVVSEDRKRIMKFDSTGNFVNFIGGEGEGPGEVRIILGLSVGLNQDLIVIGGVPFKAVIYKYPSYEKFIDIKFPTLSLDVVQLASGKLVTYSLYTEALLTELSPDGKVLKNFLKPFDNKLKIFSARTYVGSLWNNSKGEIFFVDPTSGYIFRYDSSLNLICKYIAGDDLKEFFGYPKPYPQNLSPYEVTHEHVNYWKEFIHPCSGASLNDTLFIVQYYLAKNMRSWDSFRFNLISTSGEVFIVNMKPPHNGMLIFPGGDVVLEVIPGEIKGADITDAKIFRYKIKKQNYGG